jgi:hypothetical protein
MTSLRTTRERAALSGRHVATVGHLIVQVLEVAATLRVLWVVHRRRRELQRDGARDPTVR